LSRSIEPNHDRSDYSSIAAFTTSFLTGAEAPPPGDTQGDAALPDWIVLKPLLGGDNRGAAVVYQIPTVERGVSSSEGIALCGRAINP
jgi:hypothetical protein